MKRLWKRLRGWLIRKLGGAPWSALASTVQRYEALLEEKTEALEEEIEERRQMQAAWEEEAGMQRSELYREQARRIRAEKRVKELEMQANQWRQAVRVLRAEKILNPFGASSREVIELAHADLTEQIVKMVRGEVHFHTFSDFEGNCRIKATLAVVKLDGEKL